MDASVSPNSLGFTVTRGHFLKNCRHQAVIFNGALVLDLCVYVNTKEGYIDVERTINGYTDRHRLFGTVGIVCLESNYTDHMPTVRTT